MKIGLSPSGEKHRLKVPVKRVLRRIFGSKRKKRGDGETCLMRGFIIAP
jgi:hypothetical protein